MSYADLAQLKAYVRESSSDNDAFLTLALESATRTIDWVCDTSFPRPGEAAVPEAVVNACLLQASRYWSRRSAPFGVAGSPELGNELRLLNKLDPDVEVLLGPYAWHGVR